MGVHQDKAATKSRTSLAVTVDNECDGRRLTIRVGRDDPVQTAIDGLYDQLGRPPGEGDRLCCAVNGEDVPLFATLDVEDYSRQCPDLHWLFAAPVGGVCG